MKRFNPNTCWMLLLVTLFCRFVSGAIDTYDSIVVRTILDKVGWNEVTVASVVSSPLAITGETLLRVTTLNLSYRSGRDSIRELPREISQLPELVTLSLKGNALSTLPDTLATLYKLSRLDLSNNRFSALPRALEGLPLQVLQADHNSLEALPGWIGTLSRLQSASMVSNRLTTLPEEIVRCTNLATLNLDSNWIDSIPAGLTKVNVFKLGITANRLCSVSEPVARWLDNVQLTADWRATQRCELSITSTFTEAVTGTVVQVAGITGEAAINCRAVELAPVDKTTLSRFTLQQVVKAVSVTFGSCFTGADTSYFLVTFSWGDVTSAAPGGKDLAVYSYTADGLSQYLGGSVDSVHKTISIRTSREGLYLLTIPFYTAAQPSAPPVANSRVPVTVIERNGSTDLVFTGGSTREVQVRLFNLGGKLLFERAVTVPAGFHSVGLGTLFGTVRQGCGILELRSGAFHSVHRLHHLR